MHYFATLFDINYLSRGLCLLTSLKKVMSEEFHLYILALDEKTRAYFKVHIDINITVIDLAVVETSYPELLKAKENRTAVEYYFTLSPILPLYILKNFRPCSRITTLDADIYFFTSPAKIFNYYSKESVWITPHDFSKTLENHKQYGVFNVSFQSFPDTAESLMVLNDWKDKCLNWCYDFLDSKTGYFADQKYLDEWPKKFKNIAVIDLETCGRSPWNLEDINISHSKNNIHINGKPLIYYHFHQLRITGRYVRHGLQDYGLQKINSSTRRMYSMYINLLNKKTKELGLSYHTTILRYPENNAKTLLRTLWQKEIGAVIILNETFFYNIIRLKSIYKFLRFVLNAHYK
jgi:hypothetical protein